MAPPRKKKQFVGLHKLAAAVCLLTLAIMLIAGIMAGVPIVTVTYRACVAMLVVKVVTKILIGVLSNYEEIHSGET